MAASLADLASGQIKSQMRQTLRLHLVSQCCCDLDASIMSDSETIRHLKGSLKPCMHADASEAAVGVLAELQERLSTAEARAAEAERRLSSDEVRQAMTSAGGLAAHTCDDESRQAAEAERRLSCGEIRHGMSASGCCVHGSCMTGQQRARQFSHTAA